MPPRKPKKQQKRRDLLAADAYRCGDRIAVRGLTRTLGSSTQSSELVVLEPGTSDHDVGTAVLAVLATYGQSPASPDDRPLLEAMDLASTPELVESSSMVSVSLRREYEELVLAPWRRFPPHGWGGNIEDPVFLCPAMDVAGVGKLLVLAFDLADLLPNGN